MELEFTIDGRMPGLNEYTAACRRNKYAGAKMKADNEDMVGWHIPRDAGEAVNPVVIEIDWHEPNNRRDPDNISGFGHKVILDALVRAGVLPDDGRKYVGELHDKFFTDKDNPRIEVRIREIN